MRVEAFLIFFLFVLSVVLGGSAQNCGNGVVCPGGECCSEYGWCGLTVAHCCKNCQSNCGQIACGECETGHSTPGEGGELGKIISREMFEDLLKHRNANECTARCFFTYDAFIEAAQAFPAFGTSGNDTMRKREIAAFFAQTAHETTGGWDSAPDGKYAWGYCFMKETLDPTADYCDYNYPCPLPGQYYGRGPIQLTWNVNYIQCGEALGVDLLNNPNLLLTDPVLSFKSAIWFWMTAQPPKPSCHDVIIYEWNPSVNDINAGRLPGFGMTTNIINGGIECGKGVPNDYVENRIGHFTTFCEKFGIQPGDNLDCYNQNSYALNLMAQSM